jgi:hypothetical protein
MCRVEVQVTSEKLRCAGSRQCVESLSAKIDHRTDTAMINVRREHDDVVGS